MTTPSPQPETLDFLRALQPYLEAFSERDCGRRAVLLSEALAPDAEIWGPTRVFTGYTEISEKIAGFHRARVLAATVG